MSRRRQKSSLEASAKGEKNDDVKARLKGLRRCAPPSAVCPCRRVKCKFERALKDAWDSEVAIVPDLPTENLLQSKGSKVQDGETQQPQEATGP